MSSTSDAAARALDANYRTMRRSAELSRRFARAFADAEGARREAVERTTDLGESALRTWMAGARAATGPTPFDAATDRAFADAEATAHEATARYWENATAAETAAARRYEAVVSDYVALLDDGATLARHATELFAAPMRAATRAAASERESPASEGGSR